MYLFKDSVDRYTNSFDPYLDIMFNLKTTLLFFLILLTVNIFFQSMNFVMSMFTTSLMLFVSDLPYNKTKFSRLKSILISNTSIICSYIVALFIYQSISITIIIVMLYGSVIYLSTIRRPNIRIDLISSLIFIPMFVHLARISHPNVSDINMLISFLYPFALCVIFSLVFSLLIPRRFNSKAIIASISVVFDLKRMISGLHNHSFQNDYDLAKNNYQYLVRFINSKHFSKLSDIEQQILREYSDILIKIVPNFMFIANNCTVSQIEKYNFTKSINKILHNDLATDDCKTIDTKEKLNSKDVHEISLDDFQSLIQHLKIPFAKILELRNKYV